MVDTLPVVQAEPVMVMVETRADDSAAASPASAADVAETAVAPADVAVTVALVAAAEPIVVQAIPQDNSPLVQVETQAADAVAAEVSPAEAAPSPAIAAVSDPVTEPVPAAPPAAVETSLSSAAMAAPVSVAEAIALVAEPAEAAVEAVVETVAAALAPEAAPMVTPAAAPAAAPMELPLELGGLILVTTQVQDAAPVVAEPAPLLHRRRADLLAVAATETAAESMLQQVETASLTALAEAGTSLPQPAQARRADRVVLSAAEEAAAMVQVETR